MYEVEEIVNSRISKGRKQYEIKWKGYDWMENTWEPEHHLATARDLLEEFENRLANENQMKICQQESELSSSINLKQFSQSVEEDGNQEKVTPYSTKVYANKPVQETVASETPAKKPVEVICISETAANQLVYKIRYGEEQKWVERGFFKTGYLLELCEFYESKLVFN